MQNATRPDVDKLISGGQARKRRRNLTWAGGAAARDRAHRRRCVRRHAARSTATPARPGPPPTPSATSAAVRSRGPADPLGGRRPPRARHLPASSSAPTPPAQRSRRTSPSRARAGTRGTSRWSSRARSTAGSASTSPRRSRPGPAATVTRRTPPWAQTPRALAEQLARLPESTVMQPVTPAEAYGHDAFHLRLRDRRRLSRGPGATVSRRRHGAVMASATASCPRRSSWTSGSWTWTACRSWSTRGTRATPRRSWWTGSPRPRTRSPS